MEPGDSDLHDRVEELEAETSQHREWLQKMMPDRRGVIKGLGAAAIGGAAVGGATGGASAQSAAGQVGTASNPVDVEGAAGNFDSVSTDVIGITGLANDVREFGAVGDGATNDSQAFRDAILEADTNGGFVFVPAGTYYVPDLNPVDNVTDVSVVGVGRRSTITKGDGDGPVCLQFRQSENCHFVNLHVQGTGTDASEDQTGLKFGEGCSDCSVRWCWVEDWSYDGIAGWGSVGSGEAKNIDMLYNHVENVGDDAINVGAGDGVTGGDICGNKIEDQNGTMSDGIHISVNASEVTISKNRVVGTNFGIGLFECHNATVADNVIKDVRTHGIATLSDDKTNIYQNTIRGNTIINPAGRGINVVHGENHHIENNTIRSAARGIYINTPKTDIESNNIIDNSDYGIVVSVSGDDVHSKVVDNHIDGALNNDGINITASRVTVTSNTLTDANINEANGDYNTFVGNVAPGGLSSLNTNSQSAANITS